MFLYGIDIVIQFLLLFTTVQDAEIIAQFLFYDSESII